MQRFSKLSSCNHLLCCTWLSWMMNSLCCVPGCSRGCVDCLLGPEVCKQPESLCSWWNPSDASENILSLISINTADTYCIHNLYRCLSLQAPTIKPCSFPLIKIICTCMGSVTDAFRYAAAGFTVTLRVKSPSDPDMKHRAALSLKVDVKPVHSTSLV